MYWHTRQFYEKYLKHRITKISDCMIQLFSKLMEMFHDFISGQSSTQSSTTEFLRESPSSSFSTRWLLKRNKNQMQLFLFRRKEEEHAAISFKMCIQYLENVWTWMFFMTPPFDVVWKAFEDKIYVCTVWHIGNCKIVGYSQQDSHLHAKPSQNLTRFDKHSILWLWQWPFGIVTLVLFLVPAGIWIFGERPF